MLGPEGFAAPNWFEWVLSQELSYQSCSQAPELRLERLARPAELTKISPDNQALPTVPRSLERQDGVSGNVLPFGLQTREGFSEMCLQIYWQACTPSQKECRVMGGRNLGRPSPPPPPCELTSCPPHFSQVCMDVDECNDGNNGGCDPNAICTNTVVSLPACWGSQGNNVPRGSVLRVPIPVGKGPSLSA